MAIKLGDVLLTAGKITKDQLDHAIETQRTGETRKRLGEILQDLGYITEIDILKALSIRVGCPVVDMNKLEVNPDAISLIPRSVAENHLMLPFDFGDGNIDIVTNDPLNFKGIHEIRELSGLYPVISLAEKERVENAIDVYYADYEAKEFVVEANKSVALIVPDVSDLDDEMESDVTVVRLVNSLLIRGATVNSSDIHIEPYEKKTRIRIRVDGVLTEYAELDSALHPNVVARIKIMSRLDIAEKRVPQDGHFRADLDGTIINTRVSTMPTIHGEKVVIRFLNTKAEITNEDTFGMEKHHYAMVREMMKSPNGIIYVTGPTGSGKTTTLYMILEELLKKSYNISTIEDPVERTIYGLNQIQINPTAGLTFATGLRSLLRQDPDIIMVGETRDSETASISVRAAITGHLVLSTLHTNDAIASIVRLDDMGVERYLFASALIGIIAQRLMRKICPVCRQEYVPNESDKMTLARMNVEKTYMGTGCKACNNTGYLGRMGIHEVLFVDNNIRKMIVDKIMPDEMLKYLKEYQGYKTLEESARDLVAQGVTSLEEYLKVQYSIL